MKLPRTIKQRQIAEAILLMKESDMDDANLRIAFIAHCRAIKINEPDLYELKSFLSDNYFIIV